MQNTKFDIVNGKTQPLFLRYAIPNILGILALSSAQLVDAFFIGNFAGGRALASINIVLPVFSLVMGLGIMLAANEVPRIAQQFGLDSSVKVNMMSVVHATTTAVNLTRSVARATGK